MPITSSQASIVQEMFVNTADENYVATRWCSMQGLYTDFFWLGTHALEKYIKAALLYNDRSVKDYGHDVERLYNSLNSFAKDLLPRSLKRPSRLSGFRWIPRTPMTFLSHLALNGNPDNRYLMYGYSTRSQDLHMLDCMVFAVRRLICPLNEPRYSGKHLPKSFPKTTYREYLLNS